MYYEIAEVWGQRGRGGGGGGREGERQRERMAQRE